MSERLQHPSEPERDPVSLPVAGREPIAKRLNRNALAVAAVVMGVTVLTAVVLLNPRRPADTSGTGSPATQVPPPLVQPAFLDQPIRQPATPEDTVTVDRQPLASERDPLWSSEQGRFVDASTGEGGRAGGAYMVRHEPSFREKAFRAALVGGVEIGAKRTAPGGEIEDLRWSGAREELADEQVLSPGNSLLGPDLPGMPSNRARPASSTAPGGVAPMGGPLAIVRRQATSSASAVTAGANGAASATIARLVPAGSPYTLSAGTLIPGVLITGIASDLPGEIVAQTRRDVYDSRTQRILLIPKGSKLIGTYDNQVVASQSRLLVAWTRLILPDGRSMTLPGLALADAQGRSGAEGKVDNHTGRVFGHSLLLSLIGAGAQLSQPRQASVLAAPSAGQVAAGALGQELSQVALEILRRGMSAPPTITIPPGQPFNVLLNGDIVFDGAYEESR